jgi:hypothetical protein
MENQQFGDEHGLGLNDAGVESVEVIKVLLLLYGSDALGGVCILTQRNLQMQIRLRLILVRSCFPIP